MTKHQFSDYLDEAMLLLSDDSGFRGSQWMEALSATMWKPGGGRSWTDLYQPLTKMLYEIGFIGITRPPKARMVYSYDDATLADNPTLLESVSSFYIHPAYHMALDLKPKYYRS